MYCHGCGKKGHIRRACLNKYKENRTSGELKNANNVRKVSKEESSSEDDISDQECEVGYLKVNSIQNEKSKTTRKSKARN